MTQKYPYEKIKGENDRLLEKRVQSEDPVVAIDKIFNPPAKASKPYDQGIEITSISPTSCYRLNPSVIFEINVKYYFTFRIR